MTHYYICQPVKPDSVPFLAMLDEQAHDRLTLQLASATVRGSIVSRRKALCFAFGEVCDHASLTSAEYFAALRAANGSTGDDSNGGQRASIDPVKPLPRKPRGGLAARVAAHAAS
jgi:hypothetical protein